MFCRKSRPMIGKLTGSLISVKRPGFMDATMSPRSPLEFNVQSPRGVKNYEVGGIGLGIVAALEKTSDGGGEIRPTKTLFSRNSSRSEPISVISAKDSAGVTEGLVETDVDDLEDYTYVTSHGPNKKSFTRVYCDRGEYGRSRHETRRAKSHHFCVFEISTARFGDVVAFPTSDFLSSCHMCQKNLHGKDIYMYRGEKAFCSAECRYRQIVMDERKEKCSAEASRTADVSKSPRSNGQIFSTGILAS